MQNTECKRLNAKPDHPMVGDFPSSRFIIHKNPFTFIKVDTYKPFSVRVNRRTENRWLFGASCLTTNAVFINMLYTMNSDSCLMALLNLIHTRGALKRIISDKGTNFVRGSNILQEKQNEWNDKLIARGIITEPIEWDFNPAKASHMNGSVERDRNDKKILQRMHDTLNKRQIIPNDETFYCIIKETKGTVNNRPLCMTPLE